MFLCGKLKIAIVAGKRLQALPVIDSRFCQKYLAAHILDSAVLALIAG